jgi:hypothetical protein
MSATLAHTLTSSPATPTTHVKLAFALLVIVSIALPTGSLAGVPVKNMIYLAAVSSMLYAWVKERSKIPMPLISIMVWSLAFVGFFAILGSMQSMVAPRNAIQEGIGIFTTISIVVLGLICASQKWLDHEDIIVYAIWGATVFATIKNAVAIGMAVGLLGYDQALAFYGHMFNYKFISSMIFGGLIRVNLIIYDFAVLLLLAVCALYPSVTKRCNPVVRYYFIAMATVCVFVAFSRYLFIVAAFIMAYGLLFRWGIKAKLAVLIVVTPLVILNITWIEGAAEQRFNSTQSDTSDDLRTLQIAALTNQWSKSPWIGSGLGSYAKDLIRDYSLPHSYEVQWFGFFSKMGILGNTYLFLLIGLLYYAIVQAGGFMANLPMIVMLTFFIAGGFTNQYLVTSGSGLYYLLTVCVARALHARRLEVGHAS